MKAQLKYVNFYKRSLQKGYYNGFKSDDKQNLHLSVSENVAYYITPLFDTGDEDMTYNRLIIEGDFKDLRLEVVVAVTNETEFYYNDKNYSLNDILTDDNISAEEKAGVLCAFDHVRYIDTQDIILHSLHGRFVIVYIGTVLKEGADATINGLRLEFPKYSFSEYMPEIYQGNDFFDRYIAVMQSRYLDIEQQIDRLANLLDYEKAEGENLIKLASWLGMDDHLNLLDNDQLRYMIKNLDLFQGGKGTRRALEEIIKLVTGISPHIVENFQWSRSTKAGPGNKHSMELYGDTRNHFAVILNLSQVGESFGVTEKELEKLIESYSGIGTKFKLVCLRKSHHTDTYCYLDVNSYISTPQTATVDGIDLGGYIVVG